MRPENLLGVVTGAALFVSTFAVDAANKQAGDRRPTAMLLGIKVLRLVCVGLILLSLFYAIQDML